MNNDSEYLVSSFRETKRYFTYGGDHFLILPRFKAFLSQYDNCIFAVPLENLEDSDSLKESLLKDELMIEIESDTEDHDKEVLCILDSNDDNLYNGMTYSNRCVTSLGGISRFMTSPSGDLLVVIFSNNIMGFYSIQSDKKDWLYLNQLSTVKVNNNNRNITSVCVNSTDGVCIGLMDGSVLVYQDFKFHYSFRLNNSSVTLLRFLKEDKVFVCDNSGEVYMYDLATKSNLYDFQDHTAPVRSLHYIVTTTNEIGLITLDSDNIINIWSVESLSKISESNLGSSKKGKSTEHITKTPFKKVIKYSNVVTVTVVTSKVSEDVDSKRKGSWILLVVEESGQFYYEDPIDGSILLKRDVVYGFGSVKLAEYSREMELLLLMSVNGSILVYDKKFKILKMLLSNFSYLFQFCILSYSNSYKDDEVKESEETEESVLEGVDKSVGTKSLEDNPELDYYQHCKLWYERQIRRFNKRSRLMVVLLGDEVLRVLLLNNINEFVPVGLLNVDHTHKDSITSMYYDTENNYLLTGSKDKLVILWDMNNLVQLKLINTVYVVTSLLLTTLRLNNGSLDIVCGNNNVINLYTVKLASLDGLGGGDHISGECSLNTTKTLSNTPSKEIDKSNYTSVIHKSNINYLSLSHNQKYIASCGNDKIIVVYHSANLLVKGKCIGHRKSVIFIKFMKMTKTLVSSSMDQAIKIWNLTNFTNIKTFQGHDNSIMKVLVLNNNLQLLSCGLDGFVKLWNIPTSDCIQTLNNHYNQQVWDIEFRDNLLFSASNNRIVICEDASQELRMKQELEAREEEETNTKINSLILQNKYRESLLLSLKLNNLNSTNKILMKLNNKLLFDTKNELIQSGLMKGSLNQNDTENDQYLGDNKESGEDDIVGYIVEVIKKSDESERNKLLTNLLGFIKTWMGNRKNYILGTVFLNRILKDINLEMLLGVEGLLNTIEVSLFSIGNHQNRLSSLQENLYILDILTQSNPLETLNTSETNNILYNS